MATYIRTVDGKLQYEIEPGSAITMGPNLPTKQAVIIAAAAAAAAAEAAEAAAEQAMSGTPEGYAALVGSVAETYSSQETYAAGDYVLHESALYQALVDIDTPEEWTSDHWEAVTIGDELTDLKAEINAEINDITDEIDNYLVTVEETYPATPVNTSALFTKLESKSASPNPNAGYRNRITLASDDKYDTYYYVLPTSTDVYFSADTYAYYVAISYGEKFDKVEGNYIYCEEGEETYRKRSSDNNLPTQGTPISLGAGAVIAVTIRKGYTIDIYGLETVTSYQYADPLIAKIEEIASEGDIKQAKVIYNGTADGYNTERLYIYMPAKTGYVRYNFEHFERADINADVWLIHPLYAVTDALAEDFAITTTGEFECALKINGAPDFMGGSSHGSEVVQSIHIFLDGQEVNPEDITSLTTFDILRVVEQSKLYDPNDEVTEAAIHGKEYIFADGKLMINQSVKWSASFTMATSYMAMLPIAKAVSPYYVPNDNYQTYETAEEYIRRAGITSVLTWDDVKNLSVRFSIPLWSIAGTSIAESGTYLITDNSSDYYNKQYYICTSGGSVSSGDLWRTTTEYVFEIGG